jgi:hypothetical protein
LREHLEAITAGPALSRVQSWLMQTGR